MNGTSLSEFPAHLGLGAKVEIEPAFTGNMQWYEAYVNRHQADGTEGRLVSMHTSDRSWESWEMHPQGSEMVLCITGQVTFHQEFPDGALRKLILRAGEYVINPPLVWHTADMDVPTTLLFITSGIGTQHRGREKNQD